MCACILSLVFPINIGRLTDYILLLLFYVPFFRGCGGLELSVGLNTAANTDDLRMAVELVAKRYPLSSIFVVGYSLGANILVNYLGEVRSLKKIDLLLLLLLSFPSLPVH